MNIVAFVLFCRIYWNSRELLYRAGVGDNYLKRFSKSFYLPKEYHNENPQIVYIENPTAESLVEKIKINYEKTRKPIYGIEWNTHGAPGKLSEFDLSRSL